MKLIDEKGRLFGKLSLIDVIAIIVVIVLIVGIFMRFFVLDKTSVNTETTPITYQVEASSVRMYTIEAITVGDKVFDEDTGAEVGTVTAVAYEPAARITDSSGQGYFYGAPDEYYDMTVSLEAQGNQANGRTYVNKTYELNVNSKRDFFTKYCSVSVKISEIG